MGADWLDQRASAMRMLRRIPLMDESVKAPAGSTRYNQTCAVSESKDREFRIWGRKLSAMPVRGLFALQDAMHPARIERTASGFIFPACARSIRSRDRQDTCHLVAVADAAFVAAVVPEFAAPRCAPLSTSFRDFQVRFLAGGADWISYVAGRRGTNGCYGRCEYRAAHDRLLRDGDVLNAGHWCCGGTGILRF